MKRYMLFLFLLLFFPYSPAYCQSANDSLQLEDDGKIDELKTADQLIQEADFLLDDQRPLDARTKLFRALKKDPKNYRAHILLSGYYLVNVGHFRLALRYIKQAEALFEEQNGMPPYTSERAILTHGQILYLLSQARLNLDDYQGSLDILDNYKSLGYSAPWYPGTKAWTLMKLGRIEEAISEAKLGIANSSDSGRTLNMLGILLSMHGERRESLKIFRDAISFELSQGTSGQPATPLNNGGEVYKELFEDERAESNWLRAISMPDGCEHVLPTLNLSLLYFEQLNLNGAEKAVKDFASCIAQFPLKNGEEHKALVNFAQGKIAELSGHPDLAIPLFLQSLKDRQWFGKIGTDQEDLEAASLFGLAKSYSALAYRTDYSSTESISDSIQKYFSTLQYNFLSKWYERKARRVLIDRLNDFEDLSIRNTDSLLEYPTLGLITRKLDSSFLRKKIDSIKDTRPESNIFYNAYLAENLLEHGHSEQGLKLLDEIRNHIRPKFDELFGFHVQALLLRNRIENNEPSDNTAVALFRKNRSLFRNYGFILPIRLQAKDPKIVDLFESAGYKLSLDSDAINISIIEENKEIIADVIAPQDAGGRLRLKSFKITDLLNKLQDTLFSDDIQ